MTKMAQSVFVLQQVSAIKPIIVPIISHAKTLVNEVN